MLILLLLGLASAFSISTLANSGIDGYHLISNAILFAGYLISVAIYKKK